MNTRRRSAVGLAGISVGTLLSGVGLALVGSPRLTVGSFLACGLVFALGAVQEVTKGTFTRTGGLLSRTTQRFVSFFFLGCGALTTLFGLGTVAIAASV